MPGGGRARRADRAGGRPRHVPPDHRRPGRRPPDARRAVPRAAPKRCRRAARRPPGRRRRHHGRACARGRGRIGRSRGLDRAVHPAGTSVRGRRRACSRTSTSRGRRCSSSSTRSSEPGGVTLYEVALAQRYRFLSFGDAMLLQRADRWERRPPLKLTVDSRRRPSGARAGHVQTAARRLRHPVLHAGRHPGRREDPDVGGPGSDIGATVILGNTYHLMLRPGADLVERLGGLHRFTGWTGHFLTDSGGFQVFSLDPKVDDAGATFRATHDGALHHLSPSGRSRSSRRSAPTSRWRSTSARPCRPRRRRPARRGRAHDDAGPSGRGPRSSTRRASTRGSARGLDQAQFGIVQGGADPALRARERVADRRARLRRLRHRRPVGRRVPRRDAAGAGGRRRATCRPTSPGTSWGSATRPASSRRWRSASTCSTACCPPASAGTAPSSATRARYHLRNVRLHLGRGPARRPMWLPDVRPLDPRLSPAPAPGRRAHRGSAGHRAQPLVDPRPRAPHAGGHRVRHLRRLPLRHPRRLGLSRPVLARPLPADHECNRREPDPCPGSARCRLMAARGSERAAIQLRVCHALSPALDRFVAALLPLLLLIPLWLLLVRPQQRRVRAQQAMVSLAPRRATTS